MKYNYFQDEKLEYEDIEIPDELLFVVRRSVAADRKKKAAAKYYRKLKMAGSVAAILFLCLAIGVNSSYAFAETAVKIPIVKNFAKAVVVRNYRSEILAVYEENKKSGKSENTPVKEQEPPENVDALPAVSGNNVIMESEELEPSGEMEPEEILEGIDAWKAEMTLEKFREVTELYTADMEERYAQTPEKLKTILLADLPKKDIALYGYHEDGKVTGVALRVKDAYEYFDWNYMNSSKKLPEISCADVDGDGEEEIVVSLYNGTPQVKEISKADIVEPGTAVSDDENETETSGQTVTGAATEPNKTGNAGQTDQGQNNSRTAIDKTGSVNQTTAEADKTEKSGSESEEDKTEKPGQPTTEANKTEKTGQAAAAGKTEQSGKATEAGKTEQSGKATEADKTEQSGKATEADKTEQSGKAAEADKTEQSGKITEADNTEKSGQTNPETDKTEEPEQPEEDNAADTISGDNMEDLAVSGNDVVKPAEKPEQAAGEIWVVDLNGENWSASVLSADDYESQIIHRLKASYNEKKGTIQLYLVEEPFGEPVKLPIKNPGEFTYEAVNLAPQRSFTAEKGLFLEFQMEVSFLNTKDEKATYLLEPKLRAEIRLEDSSLTVENIELQ